MVRAFFARGVGRVAPLGAVLFAIGPVVIAGCEDEPAGPGPIDDIAKLPAEVSSARCDFLVRCTWLPSKSTCESAVVPDRTLVQLVSDVGEGRIAYSPAAARRYVDAVRLTLCQDTFAVRRGLEEAWDAIWEGRSKSGEPCLVDEHCEGDLACDRTACEGSGACCEGSCGPAPSLAKVGEDCTDIECVDEAYCLEDGDTQTRTCVKRHANAEACPGFDTCTDGQQCDARGGDTCYKLAARGAECNPLLRYACLDYDLQCAESSEKCVALPGPGEPCAPNGELCKLFARCNEDTNTCEALGAVGEPCGGGGDCLVGLWCDNGQCAADGTPEPCVTEPAM